MLGEATRNGDRIDTLFVGIGVALVALSAVVLAATLYFSVGLPGGDTITPALLGTVVFTCFVAVVFAVTRRLASDQVHGPRHLGR